MAFTAGDLSKLTFLVLVRNGPIVNIDLSNVKLQNLSWYKTGFVSRQVL